MKDSNAVVVCCDEEEKCSYYGCFFTSQSSLVCDSRKLLIEDVPKNRFLTAISLTSSNWRGSRHEYVPNVFFPLLLVILIICII